MQISNQNNALARFQSAVAAAKVKSQPAAVEPKPATRSDKLNKLQAAIASAKKSMPAPVQGSLYTRGYGKVTTEKTEKVAPRVGSRFDTYA